jgi:hypothetical protein
MSWDVFIQDLPDEARRVVEVPDDFQPRPLGARAQLISRIASQFPDADFTDPSWGKLQRDGYAIDISIGDDDPVTGITLHVRGSDDAVGAVVALIDAVGGRAVDSWTGELFDQAVALHSIRRWRAYLEEI